MDIRLCGSRMFQLHGDDPEVRSAHVLERVWGKGRSPERRSLLWLLWEAVAVEENRATGVATNKVAPTQQVVGTGPLVAVKRNDLTGPDKRIENANGIVFKEQGMVFRGGCQGVKLLEPDIWIEHGQDYSVEVAP